MQHNSQVLAAGTLVFSVALYSVQREIPQTRTLLSSGYVIDIPSAEGIDMLREEERSYVLRTINAVSAALLRTRSGGNEGGALLVRKIIRECALQNVLFVASISAQEEEEGLTTLRFVSKIREQA